MQQFCEDRERDQYHNVKDLAIGIITESSELLEHFLFKSKEEMEKLFANSNKRQEVSEELANVLFFVLRFVSMMNIAYVRGNEDLINL